MLPVYNPFKIVYKEALISHLVFKEKDSLWSINFKKAIASAIQVQGHTVGAFVSHEVGRRLHFLYNKCRHLIIIFCYNQLFI